MTPTPAAVRQAIEALYQIPDVVKFYEVMYHDKESGMVYEARCEIDRVAAALDAARREERGRCCDELDAAKNELARHREAMRSWIGRYFYTESDRLHADPFNAILQVAERLLDRDEHEGLIRKAANKIREDQVELERLKNLLAALREGGAAPRGAHE